MSKGNENVVIDQVEEQVSRKAPRTLLTWKQMVQVETEVNIYDLEVSFDVTKEDGVSPEFKAEFEYPIKLSNRMVELPDGRSVEDILLAIVTQPHVTHKEELKTLWKESLKQMKGIQAVYFIEEGTGSVFSKVRESISI